MQAVKTLNEHENFIAKCLCYTLLLYSTCSLLLLREDAQPKKWICWFHKKKTKAGEEFHGPLRTFDEAIARFVGGNFNYRVYTRNWTFEQKYTRRFYHLLNWLGTYIPNHRHGTRWCNKCATIADTFSGSDEWDYITPAKVHTNTMFLLFIFYFKFTQKIREIFM